MQSSGLHSSTDCCWMRDGESYGALGNGDGIIYPVELPLIWRASDALSLCASASV
jgi:hypothetical protein